MPNCFQLTKKGETGPMKLQQVDDLMRAEFGEPPSDTEWCFGWYDGIGLMMALGHNEARCKELIDDWYENSPRREALQRVNEWLWREFTVDSWSTR
jgi:hypothetical protein